MKRCLFLATIAGATLAAQPRPTLALEGKTVQLVVDLAGGSLVSFTRSGQSLNPLRWANDGPANENRPMSHFLCLDRWGQPSQAEQRSGMPFHGEATRVLWKVNSSGAAYANMSALLPIAGLHVERAITLGDAGPVVLVKETVTNQNQLGRPYNMVQHPTIGPPFLDESTIVDSNARKGFMQSSPLPNPEQPAVFWPQALKDGQPVDMRRLTTDPLPNVVSYVIDEPHGWATAVNPKLGLLVGYVWNTNHYPWFNAWRHVQDGKPLARGLEFGTTGLHQPFPILLKKGRIFDRPIFDYLDAGEMHTRSYAAFLAEVPPGYTGVERVELRQRYIVVHGRDRTRIPLEAESAVSAILNP